MGAAKGRGHLEERWGRYGGEGRGEPAGDT